MRKFLIPLLASIALPTAVNAETWWLMANMGYVNMGLSNWSIPTNSEQECEFAGQKFLNGSFPAISSKHRGYVCVKGK
tara:strand:+ start:37 stop:270 length:234 start_codon:yes stop_codon:yes gene_type:complete